MVGTALKSLGAVEEARKAAEHSIKVSEKYLELNPDDALALSRFANELIDLGEFEKGIERASRAYSIAPHLCRYNVACAYILAGKTDLSLDLLEEHAKAGAVHLDWLDKDSDWDKVRDHPRFKAIREIARHQK